MQGGEITECELIRYLTVVERFTEALQHLSTERATLRLYTLSSKIHAYRCALTKKRTHPSQLECTQLGTPKLITGHI